MFCLKKKVKVCSALIFKQDSNCVLVYFYCKEQEAKEILQSQFTSASMKEKHCTIKTNPIIFIARYATAINTLQ